ncbi:unnamed protein product [Amoebophrya sp. A120]|nr:unnamed protein product [Amoebophrya sp. A120]|eukprot:GSA120T00007923001.1
MPSSQVFFSPLAATPGRISQEWLQAGKPKLGTATSSSSTAHCQTEMSRKEIEKIAVPIEHATWRLAALLSASGDDTLQTKREREKALAEPLAEFRKAYQCFLATLLVQVTCSGSAVPPNEFFRKAVREFAEEATKRFLALESTVERFINGEEAAVAFGGQQVVFAGDQHPVVPASFSTTASSQLSASRLAGNLMDTLQKWKTTVPRSNKMALRAKFLRQVKQLRDCKRELLCEGKLNGEEEDVEDCEQVVNYTSGVSSRSPSPTTAKSKTSAEEQAPSPATTQASEEVEELPAVGTTREQSKKQSLIAAIAALEQCWVATVKSEEHDDAFLYDFALQNDRHLSLLDEAIVAIAMDEDSGFLDDEDLLSEEEEQDDVDQDQQVGGSAFADRGQEVVENAEVHEIVTGLIRLTDKLELVQREGNKLSSCTNTNTTAKSCETREALDKAIAAFQKVAV